MKDTIVKIYLQPKTSKNEIVGPYRDGIKVKVTAPPIEGKANDALIRFLAKELGISPSSIEISEGSSFQRKNLEDFREPRSGIDEEITNPSNFLTSKRKSFSLKIGSG